MPNTAGVRSPFLVGCELNELNELAVTQLGAPVFFSRMDQIHPSANDPIGRFYELVTGLYIVYHDHGIKFLDLFMKFKGNPCQQYDGSRFKHHYNTIHTLRAGLCHGATLGGGNNAEFRSALQLITGKTVCSSSANDRSYWECAVDVIERDSNDFFKYLQKSITETAHTPHGSKDWRDCIIKNILQWSGPKENERNDSTSAGNQQSSTRLRRFNGRAVEDIVSAFLNRHYHRPYTSRLEPHDKAVHDWMIDNEEKLKKNTLSAPFEMYDTLVQAINNVYDPKRSATINAIGYTPRNKRCTK